MQWIVCNVIPEIHEWHHPVWALCAKALGWHFFLFFCVFLNLTFWKLFSAPFSFVYYDPYAFFNRTCNEFKDMEINYYLCSVLILTFSLRKLVLCPRFSNSLQSFFCCYWLCYWYEMIVYDISYGARVKLSHTWCYQYH